MIGEFNSTIVLLSYGISFLGAYVAICACEQLRLVFLKNTSRKLLEALPWLSLVGTALGGVGIWCMHFVGMSAMSLADSTGNEVGIRYNVNVSVISLIVAVIGVIIGVLVASKDRFFAKSKTEILDIFIKDFHAFTLTEVKQVTQLKFFLLIIITDLKYLICGGVIAASSVVVMHYLGMAAMEFPGKIQWNAGIIAASVLIAILVSIVAFWILFRLLSIYPEWEMLRVSSALIMAVAVCGMHYCGMMAADFRISNQDDPLSSLKWTSSTVNNAQSLYPVIFAAMMTLWVFAMFIFADLRQKLAIHRRYLNKMMSKERNSNLSPDLSRVEAGETVGNTSKVKFNSVVPTNESGANSVKTLTSLGSGVQTLLTEDSTLPKLSILTTRMFGAGIAQNEQNEENN